VAVWVVLAPGEEPQRAGLALAALGLFLFLVPELVYVVDSYGERLHRMNTVFKAWIQAWVLLAAALPVLLRVAFANSTVRRAVTAALVVAALPHPLWMAANQVSGRPLGLDGMGWMAEGDRAVVRFLRGQPGTRRSSRRSAAPTPSTPGCPPTPAFLRSSAGEPRAGVARPRRDRETSRRAAQVRELYSCGDPARVRGIAASEGIPLVAIGALERADFSDETLARFGPPGRSCWTRPEGRSCGSAARRRWRRRSTMAEATVGAPELTVVVPAFNEQESIQPMYERLVAALEPHVAGLEVLFVDDGSRDATWQRVSELAARDPRVRGVRFARNFGHQAALTPASTPRPGGRW